MEYHHPKTVMLPVCCREPLIPMHFGWIYRRHAGPDQHNYVVGSFGDTPEMATALAELVIAGTKRATASLAGLSAFDLRLPA